MTTPGRTAGQIFAANDRMNQLLIEHLDPKAWTAKPPGKVRTIAAIFTHMHNVRSKWIRLTAPHLKAPAETQSLARDAAADTRGIGRERRPLRRDAWGSAGWPHRNVSQRRLGEPWPAGQEMLCYMLAHEAHHRGQVCMLAHQLGFPLPNPVASGLWNWEKLWKESGSPWPLPTSPAQRRKSRAPQSTRPIQ